MVFPKLVTALYQDGAFFVGSSEKLQHDNSQLNDDVKKLFLVLLLFKL